MNQRISRDRELSELINENHTLKLRVGRIGEIQSYVDMLVANNKSYQDQIGILQAQNRKLKHNLQQTMAAKLHMENNHQNQLINLKRIHDSEIQNLIAELKSILRDREEMQANHTTIIDELQAEYTNNLMKRKAEIDELDSNFQNKVNKMSNVIKQQQRDIDSMNRQIKQLKLRQIDQQENSSTQIRQLVQSNEMFKQQLTKNNKQLDLSYKQIRQLSTENQDLSTKVLKIEQDKNEVILQLRKQNKKVCAQLEKTILKLRGCEQELQALSQKFNTIMGENQQVRIQRNDLQNQTRKSLRNLEETEFLLKNTQQQLKLIENKAQKQRQQYINMIQQLSSSNKHLTTTVQVFQKDNAEKTGQIKDLLVSLEKIQSTLIQTESRYANALEQNDIIKSKNNFMDNQIQDRQLEIRSLREKLALYQTHNVTLDEIIQKQKKKYAILEAQKRDSRRQLDTSHQLSKRYEQQIRRLVEDFYLEKENILTKHLQQKQKIKDLYQYTLLTKQQQFNRKLQVLEEQIDLLRHQF